MSTIKQIKQLRVEQHELLLKLHALPKSREVATAITKLQESRMWLGEALGVLGSENPYPQSMNPDNDIVHPPADVKKETVHERFIRQKSRN